MTVELDKEKGPQVRVVQNREPPSFLNLFNGEKIFKISNRFCRCTLGRSFMLLLLVSVNNFLESIEYSKRKSSCFCKIVETKFRSLEMKPFPPEQVNLTSLQVNS